MPYQRQQFPLLRSILPLLIESMTNSDTPREKEVLGRDAKLLTEEEHVEGTLLELWTWGQHAPPARDTKIGATSSCSHTGAHAEAGDSHLREYKARAFVLLAEAKRIQQLYSELRQVYDIDAELTDAVEKMMEECGLRK
ncbi:hypothetical protein EI94DRAFT_1704263 [Lactarius quietus]|nr:hypothetical protein EI94DRAFT_1704263 [Lactarius quietus]